MFNREIDGRYFEEGSKSEKRAIKLEKKINKRADKLQKKVLSGKEQT